MHPQKSSTLPNVITHLMPSIQLWAAFLMGICTNEVIGGEIVPLGRQRVEPQSPRRVERMLTKKPLVRILYGSGCFKRAYLHVNFVGSMKTLRIVSTCTYMWSS